MAFNVNTDTNYAAYLAAQNGLDAYTKSQFDIFLIKEFALQVTNAATLSAGGFATILQNALASARSGNYQF